ncbi:MAG: substrate-binding domain-containing protein [Solimonas sp.]
MKIFSTLSRRAALAGMGLLLAAAGAAFAADIRVMSSGGFTAAYNQLTPRYEQASKNTVTTAYGASMGHAPDSIPSRLGRGEPADIVILAAPALDELIRQGTVVARGDAEIGFQQVSELLPITGIDYVGPLPEEVQHVTIFSAGIVVGAREPEAARELIRYLASPAAAPTVQKTGMDPVVPKL